MPSFSAAERLEQRTLLTVLYVDDTFTITTDAGAGGLDAGDTVTFAPGDANQQTGLIFGTNAFSTIQSAISAATDGDVIQVAGGEYKENPLVDKSLTIQGPNVGIAGGGVRLPEAHVVTNGNADAIFVVTVDDVSIQGLSIDGDDPLLVGGPSTSGHDLNALHAIRTGTGLTNVSGLLVQNNIIANVAIGVRGEASTATPSVGNLIDGNWLKDIGVYDFGYAVNLRTNFYADVTNNLMTDVHTGIQTNAFSTTNGPASWTFSGNEIHSHAIGIWQNLQFNGATALTIDNNQITAEPDALENNIGILLVSILDSVNVSITNTTITGTDYGIIGWNTATSNTITLDATNSIVDTGIGIYLTNNLTFNPAGTTMFGLATSPGRIVLDGVSITGSTIAAVDVAGQAGSAIVAATIQGTTELVGSNNLTDVGVLVTGPVATATIQNSTVVIQGFNFGVDVNGGTSTINGAQINNNGTGIRFTNLGTGSVTAADFDDTTDNSTDLRIDADAGTVTIGAGNIFAADTFFIDNRSIQNFDLTSYASANWEGLTNNFRIEDRLFHATDAVDVGLITWVAGNLYVSTPETGFSNETIQAAIVAATPGDTVNVEAGTYHEDLILTKSVVLQGAGLDVSVISGPIGGGVSTIYASSGADGSIIDGFTVTRDGNNVTDWNADLNTAGLSIQSNGGIEVRNSKFTGNRTGIDVNNANGNNIHNNIIDNNRTGMIFRNDGLDNLVSENDITNNWTQGVVWLGGASDGSGSGTIFTGNNISGNWYSQIENRDGTSGTVKNFSGNWLGTTTPTTDPTDEAAAPGYAAQIPVEFGGIAVAPPADSVPTLRGSGLAYLDFSPYLASGADTSDEVGFQGDFSHLIVTLAGGQEGSIGRIQEAVDLLADGSLTGGARIIDVEGGTYAESANLNKALTLNLTGNVTVDSLDSIVGTTVDLQTYVLTLGDGSGDNELAGDLQGVGGFVKVGSDTLILSGVNTYTGTTTVMAGTLLVNGSTTSVTTVNGTLGGSGVINAPVTIAAGGILAPGNSPGILSTGDLLLVAGSTFQAEVNGSIPGTEADEVVVTGTVDVTGSILVTSGTITSFPGQVITLIDNDGVDAISGTFVGLPEGSVVTINGVSFALSYVGGTGNDVILSEQEATFTIDDVQVNEAAGTLDFTVSLDYALTIDVVVNVTFTGGTATGGGTDYTSTTQQITFLAGETSHTVSVPINDDNVVESTETFFASLSTDTPLGGRAVNLTDTGVGSIVDNEVATVSIVASNDGAETNSPTNAAFQVNLSAPSSTDTVVTYTIAGTATGGSDYTTLTGTVTIPAGDTSATITVEVLNDLIAEDTETVILTLTGITSGDPEVTLDVLPLNLTATVNITDDDDLFITTSATATVDEGTLASTVVLDVDTNSTPAHTVTYALSGPDAALFSIDSATGEIRFLVSPDYETPVDQGADNVYNVTVTATGDFIPSKEATQDLTITVNPVNDITPVITSIITTASVPENTVASTVLLDIDATDADLPAQTVSYTLSGVDAAYFSIDSATGEIRFLASPDFDIPLDAGADNVYNITVVVTDSGSPALSATQDLTITVTPLNDNSPVITSSATASVSENTPIATVVLDVNATDSDFPSQTLVYSLSGVDAALFAINGTTGEITFLASPDYENPLDAGGDNIYNVTVTVTDDGDPTQFTTQDLTITVTNVNEFAPVFEDASPTYTIPENSPVGTVVGGVMATDADSPSQTVTYSIVGGNESGAFTIDPSTGVITVANSTPLNFEVTPQFTLTVRATDNGSPTPLSSDATVVVNLTDVEEGAVLTIPYPEGTYHLGRIPAFLSPDATFTYDDVSSPNYAGAQLTVSITAGRGKRDKLSIFRKGDGTDEIDVKGRRIYFNGELIGKSKGGRGRAHPDLVITFTSSASTAAVDNLVRRVNFQAKGDVGITRTVTMQVTNIGGVDSNVATRDIAVVND